MKTYIAIYQGPNAQHAYPLLATNDKEVVQRVTRLLRRRLETAPEQNDGAGDDTKASVGEEVQS